jgi:hypothetical protein
MRPRVPFSLRYRPLAYLSAGFVALPGLVIALQRFALLEGVSFALPRSLRA